MARTLGPPWERKLKGRFDKLVVESKALQDNPLGDPTRRPVWVYLPPRFRSPLPSIYVIQGYTGQVDMWLHRTAFEATMLERLDDMFSVPDVPHAAIVFVDAWTSYGGSQFINSSATGRYLDYLCDDVVPFIDERYPTVPERDRRAITGKSSGGYGAMVVPMLRPDLFCALATHAGDALFEVCYLPAFRDVARELRDKFEGSYDVVWDRFRSADHVDESLFTPIEIYGYAACYSPDDDHPGKVKLPFEVDTGRLDADVWQRWLEWDPVRMAPVHAAALKSMRRIYIDAGKSDEYYLDLGAQAFAKELDKIGAEHTLELFDGKHGGLQYRYPMAIRALAETLTS
jgi:hypothetical protein